ncbi:MAG: hypothetical protein WC823_03005 [Parcubacteria group bacterium]|jgi:hypothetical protein
MKISKLIALVAITLIISTSASAMAKEITDKIYYVKDDRTGICFAVYHTNYRQFTSVPCEKIPAALLNNDR